MPYDRLKPFSRLEVHLFKLFSLELFNMRVEKAAVFLTKKVSEYDQEIPQSQTADNPVAPRGRAAQPSQDTRKTN